MMLQQRVGLRPGEMLQITLNDIVFSELLTGNRNSGCITTGLGIRRGTKLKRPQNASFDVFTNSNIAVFLRDVCAVTPKDAPIVPYSMDTFRRLLEQIDTKLGVAL